MLSDSSQGSRVIRPNYLPHWKYPLMCCSVSCLTYLTVNSRLDGAIPKGRGATAPSSPGNEKYTTFGDTNSDQITINYKD